MLKKSIVRASSRIDSEHILPGGLSYSSSGHLQAGWTEEVLPMQGRLRVRGHGVRSESRACLNPRSFFSSDSTRV